MKRMTRPLMLGAFCLLSMMMGAGCGTMSIPPYAGGPAKYAQTRESQGLQVTADPFLDKERADTYFQIDPANRGVAIIFLRAENHSTNATWLLNEENMRLLDAAGNASMNAHDRGVKGDYGAANAVGWAGAAIGSFPMLFASGKLTSDAMVREKNFVDKEWHNQTLSPGQSAQGFIYFSSGTKTNWSNTKALRIDSLDTCSQQTNIIILPIAYEKK
jgi:hypothetical protein